MAEKRDEREIEPDDSNTTTTNNQRINAMATMNRKEKRKALKKMKRKQLRREKAITEREVLEAQLNDPEEQMRLLRLEKDEIERMERDRLVFEEREKRFLQELDFKKKQQQKEDEERQRKVDNENTNEFDDDDEWEYVEEGPAEIIWKGNEIIVKKKKVRVPKKGPTLSIEKQESERPISNPLAPQSEAYENYKSAQEVLETVAQQVPNFGTEQDKAHCPFHLKTGVCRFGARCSRVHFYPDKSCTILLKNMYSGPGLAFEQDEGLEYTDEEVERSFEDFYEDVHTEFLKFGEIVNFKVCKNASSHLRGNVYVHYKLLESAVLAYQSINGRYFAGKQISCEFINVTRWKVAICGEFMKSRLKTCSRGSTCNFIHCFHNPGGDYEWADLDKPAPRYWLKKMASLFGCASDRFSCENSPGNRSRRSRSRGSESGNISDEDNDRKRGCLRKRRGYDRGASYLDEEMHEEKRSSYYNDRDKHRISNGDTSDRDSDDSKFSTYTTRSSRKRERDSESTRQGSKSRRHETYSDIKKCDKKGGSDIYVEHKRKSLRREGKDFDEDRLDRSEHRSHRHSKKSSRKTKEAELSDNGSHSFGRDEKRHQKNRKKVSRSKSRIADTESDREKHEKEGHHRHRKRSSRHHSKDRLAKVDSVDGYKPNEKEEEKEDYCSNESLVRHKNYHANMDCSRSGEDKIDGIPQTSSCRNPVSYVTDLDFQEDNLRRHSEGGKFQSSCSEGHKSEMHHKSYGESKSQISRESNEENACQAVGKQSETELEQACRLAALKKLEELKNSKDNPVKKREHTKNMEIYSHGNLSQNSEIGEDINGRLCSSEVDRNAASIKRRRI